MKFNFKGKTYDTDSENDPVRYWTAEVENEALKHYYQDPAILENIRNNVSLNHILFSLNVMAEREENFLQEITGLSKAGTYSKQVIEDHDDRYTYNMIIHDDLIDFIKEDKTFNDLKKDILNYANEFLEDE